MPKDATDEEPLTDRERADAEGEPAPEEAFDARRRGLGSLLGLLDSGARRGQDIVAEVAKGSKEELVRVISAEVRGFLDKIDIVDLAQEIVAGLKVEAHVEIKFSRDEDGKVQPTVTRSDTKLRTKESEAEPAAAKKAKDPRPDKNGR